MRLPAADLESDLVGQLEKEKYHMADKIKNLEITSSSYQAESKRKDEKLDQMQAKLLTYSEKLKTYQEKHKQEARLVVDLFGWMKESFQAVSSQNLMVLDYLNRVFQSLVTLSPMEFSDFRLFDPKSAIETILAKFAKESDQKQLFKVLKLNKLKEAACQQLSPNPNLDEHLKSLKTVHALILKQLQGGENQDLLGLQAQLESHRNLMVENGNLLRAATKLDPPASRLEDSILLGDMTDRSVHKQGKMSANRDMSFCDFENQSILEEFPRTGRRHSHVLPQEPNLHQFLRDEANLRVSITGQSMYNG